MPKRAPSSRWSRRCRSAQRARSFCHLPPMRPPPPPPPPPLPPLPPPLHQTRAPSSRRGARPPPRRAPQLVEWFAENYKSFGTTLEFVTNRSQEGSQFVKGFGGIGGILRYKVEFVDENDTFEGESDDGEDAF